MTEFELYKKSDEVLGQFLLEAGFRRAQPGEYLRGEQNGGEDRVMVSKGPPSRGNKDFAVFLSYYPPSLDVLKELYGWSGSDRGFPVGPYLNPANVGSRPKYWSCKDMPMLMKSLSQVLIALERIGLPWLETLRDPVVFAANVDPMAIIGSALANEAAGNLEKARGFYQEQMRRYLVLIKDFGEQLVLQKEGKPFVYVAKKLDTEKERRERFENRLDYHPLVNPL